MPLNPAILQTELDRFANPDAANFSKFPEGSFEVANVWSLAVNEYAKGVIPISTGAAAATAAMFQVFANITEASKAEQFISQGFDAFAIALGLGMAPAFIATPPPVPIDFSVIAPAGFAGAPASVQLPALVSIIDLWFRTGTAVPSGGGAPINWS